MFYSVTLISIISTLVFLTPSAHAQANFSPVTSWRAGGITQTVPGRFCDMTDGSFAQFQGDGNVVVYTAEAEVLWASSQDGNKLIPGAPTIQCPASGTCSFDFQSDGNLVVYFDGTALWNTGTAARGAWFVCQQEAPYLYITDAAGTIIWET